ncbi:hypothetical protein ACEWY4_025646 [Coilia grayii]|uniref:IRF tryptophan pentad repeat domain-containing protein n=1 Tax=Coilia grayii TaxID=363190 RepID=A0ABD1IVJ8_9TELE
MALPKPLLIPWLREQIDSGRYPGVKWTNEEQTEFSIPWKHALRQDSNSDDVLIFRAWAETSLGRQSDGSAPGDPSVWKRNFRSALRARGFSMVKDNKNDAANPHKVYRWPKEGSQSGASCEASPVTDSPVEMGPLSVYDHIYLAEEDLYQNENGPDILQQCMGDLNIYEQTADLPFGVEGGIPECIVAGAQIDAAMFGEGFPIQETLGALPQPQDFSQEVVQSAPSVEQAQVQDIQPGMHPTEPTPFKTFFRVVVHYRGKRVFQRLIPNETGFRLAYRAEDCVLSDPALETVLLPPPDSILDENQANLTREILQKLGGGLEVRTIDHTVHGSRHGDSKVFWSIDKHDHSRNPRELSKQQPEPIFSFRDYISALMSFIKDGSKCPPTSLFFCLGEKWPDPKLKPWDKKLIFVEVIFEALEELKTIALKGGASSLQSSVELQISLEQMMMDMS